MNRGYGKGQKKEKERYSSAASSLVNIAGLGHLHGGIGLETSDLDHVALDSMPLKSLLEFANQKRPSSRVSRARRQSKKAHRSISSSRASSDADLMTGFGLDELPIETLESLTKEIKSLRNLSGGPYSKSYSRKARSRARFVPSYAESKLVETIVAPPAHRATDTKPFGMPSSALKSSSLVNGNLMPSDFSAVMPLHMTSNSGFTS